MYPIKTPVSIQNLGYKIEKKKKKEVMNAPPCEPVSRNGVKMPRNTYKGPLGRGGSTAWRRK